MKLILALVLVSSVAMATAAPQPKVASTLLRKLESGERMNVIVTLSNGESTTNLLNSIKTRKYGNRAARLNGVNAFLKSKTASYQKDLLAFLNKEKSADVTVKALYVENKVILKNVDLKTVQKVLSHPDVATVAEPRRYELHPLGEAKAALPSADPVWSITKINAPSAWKTTKGQNITVANIDTGVNAKHESLVGNHRPVLGWYDPIRKLTAPSDVAGHGTHTMGSICGAGPRQIGVAPESEWIACRGCDTRDCPEDALLECGEWVSCPYDANGENEDCSKAAHVVSNSWGGGQGDDFYKPVIDLWRAAGIIPIFSIGNSGAQGCGSANSPGDSPDVIGVGATNSNDRTSTFSSRGPTVDGRRKPDVSGPGTDVISASYTNNSGYTTMSGTSMSCPHVAGLTALLLSANPDLTYDQVKSILERSADPHNPQGVVSCGGLPNNKWPNNHVGHGRINALTTVNNANSAN